MGAALILSGVQNPDGTYVGPDNPAWWWDWNGDLYRRITNPSPNVPNWRNFSGGLNRAQAVEDVEWYTEMGKAPETSSDVYTGLYFDSTAGWWSGWGTVHNFNPNHWSSYAFSPGYFGGGTYKNYSTGQICMWEPYSNVEMISFAHDRMLLEHRPIYCNTSAAYELFMVAPFIDAFMAQECLGCCSNSMTNVSGSNFMNDWASRARA